MRKEMHFRRLPYVPKHSYFMAKRTIWWKNTRQVGTKFGTQPRSSNTIASSDSQVQEIESFRAEFALLDALIERLQASIPSNSFATPLSVQSGLTPPSLHTVPRFLIHIQSVLSLATIRLHRPFCESYAPSNAKCITAAMRIACALQGMNLNALQFDPIVVSPCCKLSCMFPDEVCSFR